MDGPRLQSDAGATEPHPSAGSQPPVPPRPTPAPISALGAAQPASHPFPVLVADSDRGLRVFLSHILALEGYNVAAAGSGPDCLDYLASHRAPHILFVNIVFDANSDIHILRYLRGNPTLRKRLGVVVSGAHFNLRRYARHYSPFIATTISIPNTPTQIVAAVGRAERMLSARLSQPHE